MSDCARHLPLHVDVESYPKHPIGSRRHRVRTVAVISESAIEISE